MNSKPKWILNNSGAAKSIVLCQAFYKACVERTSDQYLQSLGYQVWMSSPFITKDILAFPEKKGDLVATTGVIDFRKSYLEQVDDHIHAINGAALTAKPHAA